MAWWQKVAFPVRRAWVAVATRVRSKKDDGGILKLQDDVQTCGYSDVQVMWEMLSRTDTVHVAKSKRSVWWMPVMNRRVSFCSGLVSASLKPKFG